LAKVRFFMIDSPSKFGLVVGRADRRVRRSAISPTLETHFSQCAM
jgi:hypothetical protein